MGTPGFAGAKLQESLSKMHISSRALILFYDNNWYSHNFNDHQQVNDTHQQLAIANTSPQQAPATTGQQQQPTTYHIGTVKGRGSVPWCEIHTSTTLHQQMSTLTRLFCFHLHRIN